MPRLQITLLLMKYLHLITVFLFGSFVWVQYNDPDFLIWSLVYVPMILIAFGFIIEKENHLIPLIYSALLLTYLILHLADLSGWVRDGFPSMMDTENTRNVEGIREFFGVAITFIFAMLYYYLAKRKRRIET